MPHTGARILYVDDDPALRRLVERDLTRRGYRVTTAPDGAAGVRLVGEARERFDAVCLDHYMPGQDGLETLAQLLALPDPPSVVYVTGSEEGRIAVAALRAGAVDYVVKQPGPDFTALLDAAVADAVERAALRRGKAAAEAAVREALARAEELAESRALLLREVNHRVSNSLQLIASFARLQEGSLTDPAARQALGEMRHRVAAVAQVHRRLYTSDDVRSVALDDYLAGLVEELSRSVGGDRFDLQAERLSVPTDRAVSLGVIVSELVTNALKYAYPDGREGPIRIRLARAGADNAVLAIEDEGVGAPTGSPAGGTGLGQRIVTALASSIGGVVEQAATVAGGTTVSVRFGLG